MNKRRNVNPPSHSWEGAGGRALLFLLLLAGCRAHRAAVTVASDYQLRAPRQVAVLMLENEALDLYAPEMIRGMAAERLGHRGYQVQPLDTTVQHLRDMGVSDGGQLRALQAQEVGARLGVDGLLYGTIEDFTYNDVGFGTRKSVRLRFALVTTADGDKLWEAADQETDAKMREAGDLTRKGVIEDTVKKALENMRQRPLHDLTQRLMDRLFLTLPPR